MSNEAQKVRKCKEQQHECPNKKVQKVGGEKFAEV